MISGLNIVHGDTTASFVHLNGNTLRGKWKDKLALDYMPVLNMLETTIITNAQSKLIMCLPKIPEYGVAI